MQCYSPHMSAAPVETPFWLGLKPKLGEEADFDAVRGFLGSAGFTYENVNQRLGVAHTYQYRSPEAKLVFAQPIEDSLGALVRLFVQGVRVQHADLARIPEEIRAALTRLGLLDSDPEFPGYMYGVCALFPFPGGVYTACDRCCSPGADEYKGGWAEDVLYPPLFENTLNFVARLPIRPCEAMLDIGTGTGVAALANAGAARQAWATDITARSVHFAEFNRRLNGARNVTVLEGDLYAPVQGLTFDRIATHPPYVPGKAARYIYREGGEDGEQVFRRVVEGLPRYLRPGGRMYSMLMGSDRGAEKFETRIRKWLGAEVDEFNILIAFEAYKPVAQMLSEVGGIQESDKEDWRQVWAGNGTTELVYGSVVIERRKAPGVAATARILTGSGMTGTALDTLMDWIGAGTEERMEEMVLNSRPALAPNLELVVTHRMRNGQMVPEDYEFKVHGAAQTKGKTPPWMARTLVLCDGTKTWREHFERLRGAGEIPPHAKAGEFARMLHALVASGAVIV